MAISQEVSKYQSGDPPSPGECASGVVIVKTLFSMLVIVSAAFLLAGCSGEGEDSSDEQSGGASGKRSGSTGNENGESRPDALAGVWAVIQVDAGIKKLSSSEKAGLPEGSSRLDRIQYAGGRDTPLLRLTDRCVFDSGRVGVRRLSRSFGRRDRDEDDEPAPFYETSDAAQYKLNTKPSPWQIDFTPQDDDGWLVRGVCEVKDDTLRLCVSQTQNARPKKLSADVKESSRLYVLERVAPLPARQEQAAPADPLQVTSFTTLGVTLEQDAEGRILALAVSRFDANGGMTNSADFGDRDLARLLEVKSIERLDLRGSKVSGRGLEQLEQFPRLRVLRLDSLPVTDATLEIIGRMERLEALSLRGTRVGDTGLEFLTELKYLHVLDVSATRVKGPGRAALKKALPHLVVRRAR